MLSIGDSNCIDEIKEELGAETMSAGHQNQKNDEISLYVQTSQRRLLDGKSHRNKFLDIVKGLNARPRFMKLGSSSRLSSPSAKFRQIAEERDEISRSVASSATQGSPQHFHPPFSRKINWTSLKQICKEWFKNPVNMALFVWILCVAISGAILFMVMTGMLNGVLPRKSQRDAWFEVNNQILNALFTLMCLYQHPRRFHHLALLCRWRPDDVLKLRKIYCKNGTYKPHEWTHMMIVVALLHLNCFAQYALCGLNLGYPRSKRPPIGVGLCISVAIAAPAFASLYNMLSPLGKEYETEMDQQSQNQITNDESILSHPRLKSLEKRYSFISREEHRVPESSPAWVGGLFDLWDDISLAYLSMCCSFCVFGWNMDRLGFGNMYVHIATFLLLCMAPFWIFNLAAVNIDNEAIRETLGLTGFVLCVLGLLYGGFWRIQMRKRFNLPANEFCCGNAAVTDCFQWLCCCSCSLAQEVRTADFYDVVEDKFYPKQLNDGTMLSPLPREDGLPLFRSTPSSPYRSGTSPSVFRMVNSPSPSRFSDAYAADHQLSIVEEGSSVRYNDITMTPPAALVMQKHDSQEL